MTLVVADCVHNHFGKINFNSVFFEFRLKLLDDKIKSFEPDLLLAIGGGSVIDTAKLISHAYYYGGDAFDFNLHKATPTKVLPLGVILTISAAGSEMSTSCVMQDDKTKTKAGFNSELNSPLFAICDPLLTTSVSKIQTAYGIVDILMHTQERYFTNGGNMEMTDKFYISSYFF